jgi:hypothetical protein
VSGHPDGADLEALRVELQRTADTRDATEQMLEIAAVVDAALRPIDVRPIVVGGLAVAYWTTGLYLTGDIDVVMPHSAEIDQRLAALGFERDGRFWTLPGREPVFEAPGSTLELNPDGHIEVELASGRTIRIQDAEEVLLLRLAEFTATGNADVFQQCLWLLGVAGLDRERLRGRAADESLARALDALYRIGKRVQQDATKLELWEITDLAKSLRAPADEP